MKRIEINLDYIRPNSSFIYKLYSRNGHTILKERSLITTEKIEQIKKVFGSIVYYHDPGQNDAVPLYRLKIALNKSTTLMDEIGQTQKLSRTNFRESEKIVEEIISDLDSSEIISLSLLKDANSLDEYIYHHPVNVCVLTATLAKLSGIVPHDDIKYLALGAYLSDIGMMKIDKQILEKKGKYTVTDLQQMKRHPQLGYELLKEVPNIHPIILKTVLFHHEKFNNKGYYGLPYDNLPIHPKILSACDTYDSLTSKRPFRDAIPPSRTLKFMVNFIGTHYNYDLISTFINHLGPLLNNIQLFYRKDDFVELNTDELASITDFGSRDLLKPEIKIFCKFIRKGSTLSAKFFKKPVETDLMTDPDRVIRKFITNQKHIDFIKSKIGTPE